MLVPAEGNQVSTDTGHKIKCDAVVLATNSPINHNLAVHARQLPYRLVSICRCLAILSAITAAYVSPIKHNLVCHTDKLP